MSDMSNRGRVELSIVFANKVQVEIPATREFPAETSLRTPTSFELKQMVYDLRYILIECKGQYIGTRLNDEGHRVFDVTVPMHELAKLKRHVLDIKDSQLAQRQASNPNIVHWSKHIGFHNT